MLGRWVIEHGDDLTKERDSIQNFHTSGHGTLQNRGQKPIRATGSGILLGDFISLYTKSYACKVLSTWLQKCELNKEDNKEMWKQLEENPWSLNPAQRTIRNKAWERSSSLVKNSSICCPGQMVAPKNLHTVTLHWLIMLHTGMHMYV